MIHSVVTNAIEISNKRIVKKIALETDWNDVFYLHKSVYLDRTSSLSKLNTKYTCWKVARSRAPARR